MLRMRRRFSAVFFSVVLHILTINTNQFNKTIKHQCKPIEWSHLLGVISWFYPNQKKGSVNTDTAQKFEYKCEM